MYTIITIKNCSQPCHNFLCMINASLIVIDIDMRKISFHLYLIETWESDRNLIDTYLSQQDVSNIFWCSFFSDHCNIETWWKTYSYPFYKIDKQRKEDQEIDQNTVSSKLAVTLRIVNTSSKQDKLLTRFVINFTYVLGSRSKRLSLVCFKTVLKCRVKIRNFTNGKEVFAF